MNSLEKLEVLEVRDNIQERQIKPCQALRTTVSTINSITDAATKLALVSSHRWQKGSVKMAGDLSLVQLSRVLHSVAGKERGKKKKK